MRERRQMSLVERRILAAVREAKRQGLEPKSLYLSPDDREQLSEALGREPEQVGALPVRCSARRSQLYCRHGIERAIPAKLEGRFA